MKFLTRQEELILLTIFRLKDNAYIVKIREHLMNHTGKDWSIGAVYVPMDRLRKLGMLDTVIGEPTAKRGGKAIKYYRLTNKGVKSLEEIKKVQDVMWEEFNDYAVENNR
ncbi:MAG: hypothetical protein GY863_06755 [bacterium]|nr:hypothetical protein [bacterium]